MRIVVSILLGLGILGAAGGAVYMLALNKPIAEKVKREQVVTSVNVLIATKRDVTLQIPSQGLVNPIRSTTLAAQVAGRVNKVTPRFKVGERFAENEILIEIEDSDYRSAITQAESALAEASAALIQEQARADQALRDWNKISPGQKPTDLAARKPQLMSAQARVDAAADSLARAKRDLERTKIRAPFAGRLSATYTELGSYLPPGTRVADLESTGRYEVRLPVSLDDLAFIKSQQDGKVTLHAEIGGEQMKWTGTVVRTEGEVERASRSVYLVAEIAEDDTPQNAFLKPGLFLRADVEGRVIPGVFEIPRLAFLDETHLRVVGDGDKLFKRKVKVTRRTATTMLVSEGLKEGDRVCLTSLPASIEGMQVNVIKTQGTAPSGSQPAP